MNKVVTELSDALYVFYKEAAEMVRVDTPRAAKEHFDDLVDNHAETLQTEYNDKLVDETAKSERQAWAHALTIARELNKHNIVLWTKGIKELSFFIARLINAHGLEAGRRGVKNPRYKKLLHIPT